MKTEITLVIVMLASGFAAIVMLATSEATEFVPVKSVQLSPSPIALVTAHKIPQQQDPTHVALNPVPSPDFDSSHNELIRNAAQALNQSVPLRARLRYKINLFGESISGPGSYFQKGGGTRLTRMQFEFGFNQSSVQIHQFCDGDKLYTLSIAGDKTNLEYVDLRKLDSLQHEVSSASRVGSWLSVGSLTGLMEQLSTHFVFDEVEEGMLDSIPVVVCTGQWNPPALARLLEGQDSAQAAREGQVRWQQLPQHLPHRVKLTLGMDQKFPYFPYRVVFEKFRLVDGKQATVEIAVLELFEVKHDLNLDDKMFSIPSLESLPENSTEFYRKRIQQFTR